MLHSFRCPPKPPKFPDGCDIPRNSNVYIASLPHRNVVFDGRASRSASIDLDPGKYVCRVHWATDNDGRSNVMNWQWEFYVGMDEKTWRSHVGKRPRFSKAIQTTDGPRWHCGFMGCAEEFQTMIGMVEHEYLHYGVQLFVPKEGVELEGVNKEMTQLARTIEGQAKALPVGVHDPSQPILPPVTKLGSMPPSALPVSMQEPDGPPPMNTEGVPLMTAPSKRPARRPHTDEDR